MTLTIHIRDLRLSRNLTQKELAERVGISHVHVSQIERGLKNLNNRLLESFAIALDVRPEDLIATSENDAVDVHLIENLHKLSSGDRARVATFVEALLITEKESGKH